MNKYFKEVVTHKALGFKLSGHLTGHLADSIIEETPSLKSQFKNVCAPIPLALNEELENMLGILNLTKREFLTFAISSAIDEAKAVMDEIDIDEYHLERYEYHLEREDRQKAKETNEAA
jgi:hypothetical protein